MAKVAIRFSQGEGTYYIFLLPEYVRVAMDSLDHLSQQIFEIIASSSPPQLQEGATWKKAIAVLLSESVQRSFRDKVGLIYRHQQPRAIVTLADLLKQIISVEKSNVLGEIVLEEQHFFQPEIVKKEELTDIFKVIDFFQKQGSNYLIVQQDYEHFGLLSKNHLALALDNLFKKVPIRKLLDTHFPRAIATDSLFEIAEHLAENQLETLVILEPKTERPLGFIHTLTLLQGLQEDSSFLSQPLSPVIQPFVNALKSEDHLSSAQELWRKSVNGVIPIIDDHQLQGILSPGDLLKLLTPQNLLTYILESGDQEEQENKGIDIVAPRPLLPCEQFLAQEDNPETTLFCVNESQKLLEGIASSIPGLAYLVNYQTNEILYHNHQAKELLGYSDAEIEALGANFLAILIHPEDRVLDFRQWQAVINDSTTSPNKKTDEEMWSLQMRLRDRDGFYKWFLVRQTIYERDAQGKVLLGTGLALDIHELKLTEELLHSTEERLRFLLEASPVVIYTAHATNERECTYTSKNVKALLGYSSGEFLSNYNFWLKRIHSEDRSQVLGSFNYLLDKKSYIQEYRFQHKEGHYLWLRDEQRLVSDAQGNISEIIGSVVDISDRRNMELALQTSEKHLNTIVSKISDGIIILDQQGHIHFANPMASQMFNLKPSEIEDFVIKIPDHPEESWDMGIVRSDGSSGIAEVKISWVTWKGASRYLMAIRDVTSHREDAEKIRQSAERERLLNTIAQRIRQSLDLEEILTTTVEEVRLLLNCDRVLIYQVHPQGTGEAIAESVREPWIKVLDLALPEEVFPLECYEPYYQGKIFVLDDRRGTPESGTIRECLVDFLRSIEVQAKLVVPIIQADCLWGLLIAHQCSEPRHWEEWEVRFLKQLSTQLSLAIQQSLLLQQLQQELTERQQIEHQLIAVTQLQRGILDGANYSIIAVNIDGIIQSFNRGAEQLLGYQAEELIGLETPLIFHDLQEITYHAQVLSQELGRPINPDFEVFSAKPLLGLVDEQEWTYIHKNGDRIPVSLSIAALLDREGNCSGFVGIASDIRDRKAIEVERRKLEFLVKKSAEFISISDLDGNVIFLNEAGQKLVGLPNLQAVLKTKIEDYHPPKVFKFLHEKICPVILKQGHWEGESVLQHFVTQEEIPVLLTAFVLQDSQTGEPTNIVGIMHDITHLKQAEQTMRDALEQERELSELRSRFISMASHEFRTPLSVISSSTEIIEKYHERLTIEKQAAHLHRIQTSVHHMARLLDDVLLVSRAEANQLPFHPTEQNIKDFCTQLVEELQLGNREHHIRFTAKAKGPASPQKWQIVCDSKLIRQILTNLLTNGIKYSPQGGEIELKLNREAGQTIFQVKDHGIGIPPEDLARLSTPFHRAHNVGTIQGTGLGLTIIQKCVELHNGSIRIESKIGIGTSVTVTIPDFPSHA